MPIITNSQPTNPNLAYQTNYRFLLQRAPSAVFWGDSATIPSIDLEHFEQVSPFVAIPRPGNKIRYSDYNYSFRVDEDFKNYLEIFNWMNYLGFPDDFTGYEELKAKGLDEYSDATLVMLTSKKNPNLEITFRDMFPISLSELPLDITDEQTEPLIATVRFRYQRFYIRSLRNSA